VSTATASPAGVSTVEAVIAARKAAGSGALVGYLPVGFPDLRTSIEAAVALAENGVDVIELGLPYSDPVMDGPVIQAATLTAINSGFKLRHGFEAIAEITARTNVPVLLMTYWNPVVQYGVERFADDLVAAGGAGLITPDLIPDEARDWLAASSRTGLDRVFLAAPSSTETRLRLRRLDDGDHRRPQRCGCRGEDPRRPPPCCRRDLHLRRSRHLLSGAGARGHPVRGWRHRRFRSGEGSRRWRCVRRRGDGRAPRDRYA
jgi:hypothetical protein